MVNAVLNAVTKQLGTTFGNTNRYYVEDVEQMLETPCFNIALLLPLQRSRSPVLYDRKFPIVIHWFSDSKNNIKKECYEMAEQVVECLEYLPFKDTLLRGEDISWQIVDDVLQIFITYSFTTKLVTPVEETPEELSTNIGHS